MRLNVPLIFDCDGVLVDSELLAARAYDELLGERGADLPEGFWANCIGRKQAEIFALIEQASGVLIAAELRATLWPRTQALFAEKLRPTPGVAAFLEAHAGPRCVASSSDPERIRFSLQATGLARFFGDAVVSSDEVPHGKPAPDIFFRAAEKLGLPAHDFVVIEDSALGVQGAVAAGARAIGFLGGSHVGADHAGRLRAAGAVVIAESWPAVAQWLGADRAHEL